VVYYEDTSDFAAAADIQKGIQLVKKPAPLKPIEQLKKVGQSKK